MLQELARLARVTCTRLLAGRQLWMFSPSPSPSVMLLSFNFWCIYLFQMLQILGHNRPPLGGFFVFLLDSKSVMWTGKCHQSLQHYPFKHPLINWHCPSEKSPCMYVCKVKGWYRQRDKCSATEQTVVHPIIHPVAVSIVYFDTTAVQINSPNETWYLFNLKINKFEMSYSYVAIFADIMCNTDETAALPL